MVAGKEFAHFSHEKKTILNLGSGGAWTTRLVRRTSRWIFQGLFRVSSTNETKNFWYVFLNSLTLLRFSSAKWYILYVTYNMKHIIWFIPYVTYAIKRISALFTDNINDIRRIYDQCNNVKTQKLRRKRQGSNENHLKFYFRFRLETFDSQAVEMFEKFVKSHPDNRWRFGHWWFQKRYHEEGFERFWVHFRWYNRTGSNFSCNIFQSHIRYFDTMAFFIREDIYKKSTRGCNFLGVRLVSVFYLV